MRCMIHPADITYHDIKLKLIRYYFSIQQFIIASMINQTVTPPYGLIHQTLAQSGRVAPSALYQSRWHVCGFIQVRFPVKPMRMRSQSLVHIVPLLPCLNSHIQITRRRHLTCAQFGQPVGLSVNLPLSNLVLGWTLLHNSVKSKKCGMASVFSKATVMMNDGGLYRSVSKCATPGNVLKRSAMTDVKNVYCFHLLASYKLQRDWCGNSIQNRCLSLTLATDIRGGRRRDVWGTAGQRR